MHGPDILNISHSFVSHISVQTQSALSLLFVNNAQKVVFEKMLALFSVLDQQGCLFHVLDGATQGLDLDPDPDSDSDSDSDSDLDPGSEIDADIDYISDMDIDDSSVDSTDGSHLGQHADFDSILQHLRNVWQCQPLPHTICSGRMVLKQDHFNRHFVQYEFVNFYPHLLT